jgi:hypothetical protein
MRKLLLGVLAIFVAAMLGGAPVRAHHGWSAYDAAAVIKVEAPVKAVRYGNPHGEIEIDYEGKTWVVVLAPPSRMQARGLTKEELVEGAAVTVEAYPRRDGTPEMRAERITLNGKTVELR